MKNKVILIGKLGADPDVRTAESGVLMARMSLATNRVYKDSKGERQTETMWHSIVAFGPVVKIVEQYCSKGQEIAVEGRLTYRTYEDKEGKERTSVDILLEELSLLGKQKQVEAA